MPIIQGAAGFDSTAYVIQVDPLTQGFQAPVGAQAFSFLTLALYIKIGNGPTEWFNIGVGGDGAAVNVSSGEIDFLTTSSDNLMTALPPGYYLMPVTARFLITQLNGTIGTGATMNCGNNTAKTNALGSAVQLTVANIGGMNTSGAPSWSGAGNTTNLTLQTLVDTKNRFKCDVTSPASGGTATIVKGRLFLNGCLMKIPS